jgi:hypothetical protein
MQKTDTPAADSLIVLAVSMLWSSTANTTNMLVERSLDQSMKVWFCLLDLESLNKCKVCDENLCLWGRNFGLLDALPSHQEAN